MDGDNTFHARWVSPFYGELMNMNFLRLPPVEQEAFASRFRLPVGELPDQDVQRMLHASWRPSKVAAWVIAARRASKFAPLVAAQLLKRPHYTEHLCVALARVGDGDAEDELLRYVTKHLDTANVGLISLDTVGTTWALASLQVRADSYGSTVANTILSPGGLWEQFLEEGRDAASKVGGEHGLWAKRWRELWSERLARHTLLMSRAVRFLAEHFDQSEPKWPS